VDKRLQVKAKDGVYIRLTNLHNRQIFVQIGLQGDPVVINTNVVTKDDHFSLQAQKISAIHQESVRSEANRYRYYKTEWGFHER